jgi:hypothetical protein
MTNVARLAMVSALVSSSARAHALDASAAGEPAPSGALRVIEEATRSGPSPVTVALLVVAAALYALGVRRLWARAGRGRGIHVVEVAAFAVAWLAVAVALVSPVDAWSDERGGARRRHDDRRVDRSRGARLRAHPRARDPTRRRHRCLPRPRHRERARSRLPRHRRDERSLPASFPARGRPTVAALDADEVVVAWEEDAPGAGAPIGLLRVAAAGVPVEIAGSSTIVGTEPVLL